MPIPRLHYKISLLNLGSCLKRIFSSKMLVLYIFVFGFMVRLIVGLLFADKLGDSRVMIAQNIARGHGYSLDGVHPTAMLPPAYPFIMAGAMALFGEQKLTLVIITAIVAAFNVVLCTILGAQIFSRKTALIAGLLYTFVPYLAQKEATTEGGFLSLGLLASVYLLLRGWRSKKTIFFFFCGLMLSFSFLVRNDIIIIPIFIFLSLLISKYRSKKTTIKWHVSVALVFILSFAIGVIPWAIRNKKVLGRHYIGQEDFWWIFYISNHRQAFQIYPQLTLDNLPFMIKSVNTPLCKNEPDCWRKQALLEIRKIPLKEMIKRSLKKFIYLWSVRLVPYTDRIGNDYLTGMTLDTKRPLYKNLAFSIPYLFLLIFALIGCWQERRRKRLLLFMMGFLISFSITYMILRSYSRYTTYVYFILIILAAQGLISLLEVITRRYLTESPS